MSQHRARRRSNPEAFLIKLTSPHTDLWASVTRSAKGDGWQTTYFRGNEPLGDIQAPSPGLALREALSLIGARDIQIEPHGEEASRVVARHRQARARIDAWIRNVEADEDADPPSDEDFTLANGKKQRLMR